MPLTLITLGKETVDAHNQALGVVADTTVRVMRATPGHRYRMVTSGGNRDAVVDANGTATFTGPYPVAITSLTGYSDPGFSVPVSGQSVGAMTVTAGMVFDADPLTLGADQNAWAHPVDPRSSYYYSTSQIGAAHAQIAESDDYIFTLSRRGGRSTLYTEDAPGEVVVHRFNKATGLVDQGPVVLGASPDGHEGFSMELAPNGILRVVWGGNYAVTMQYRETTTPYSITAWSATIAFPNKPEYTNDGGVSSYDVAPDGRNRILFLNVGGDFWLVTWPNASPTSGNVVWRKLGDSINPAPGYPNFGFLVGGMAADPDDPDRLGIVFGAFTNPSGSWPGPTYDTNYRHIYYCETSDDGLTLQKADGSAISKPISFGAAGTDPDGYCNADPVLLGWHYASSAKVAFFGGRPYVLDDADRHVPGSRQGVSRWNGSAWERTEINGLETSGAGSYYVPSGQVGWGQAFTSNDAGLSIWATLYEPADRTAKTPGTGPRLSKFTITGRDTPGALSYAMTVPLDGADYSDLQWPEYDLWYDNGRGGMGDYTYGAGWQYPKVAKSVTSPDRVLFTSVDYKQGSLLLFSSPLSQPVGRSLAIPYNVKTAVGRSLALPYGVAGAVGRSLALPYNVNATVGRSLELAYGVETTGFRTMRLLIPAPAPYPTRRTLLDTLTPVGPFTATGTTRRHASAAGSSRGHARLTGGTTP